MLPLVAMLLYPPTGYWSSSGTRVGTSLRPTAGRTGRCGNAASSRATSCTICRWATYCPRSARAVRCSRATTSSWPIGSAMRRAAAVSSPYCSTSSGCGPSVANDSYPSASTFSADSPISPRTTAGDSSTPPTPARSRSRRSTNATPAARSLPAYRCTASAARSIVASANSRPSRWSS